MQRRKTKIARARCSKRQRGSRGLSIVEALISVAILVFVFSIVVSVVVVLAQGQGHIRVSRRLDSAAIISMERMTRTIRNASAFDIARSVFDTHPGRLSVIETGEGVSTTTLFSLSGATLMVGENGITEGPLTSSLVSVDSLIFRHIVTPVSEGVRIEMQVSSVYGTTTGKAALYTTVFARGSY